jgi:hypothetical protein
MKVLILAARSQGVEGGDGDYPLCLTEFDGAPLIERLIACCSPLEPSDFIFALREQDVQRHHLDNIVMLLTEKARVLRIRGQTAGATCTALLAAGSINTDEDLLILGSNELLDVNFKEVITSFRHQRADCGVITFPSIHPRYSYIRIDEKGFVVEAAEKNPISRRAVASFHWFAHGKDFVRAAQNSIRKDAHINGVFFISPVLNELVLEQKKIIAHPIDIRQYHPLKTERQVDQFGALFEGKSV